MSSPFWHQRRKVSEYGAFDYPHAMDSRPTATPNSCRPRDLVLRSPSTATAVDHAMTAALTPSTERRCGEPNLPLPLPPRSSSIPLFNLLNNLSSSQSLASYLYSDPLSSTPLSPPPSYTRAISTTGVSQMAPVRFITGRTTNRKQRCKTPVYQIPINLIRVPKLPTYAEIGPAHSLAVTAEAEAASMIKDVLTLPGCKSSGQQGQQGNEQDGGGGLSCSYTFKDLMNDVHDLLTKHQNNTNNDTAASSFSSSSSSPQSRTRQHPSSDRDTSPSPPPPPPSSPTLTSSSYPPPCPSPRLGKKSEETQADDNKKKNDNNNNNSKKKKTVYSCDLRLYFNTGSDLSEYRLGPKSGEQTLRSVLEMARARGVGSSNSNGNSNGNSNSSGGVGRESIGGGRHESWGRRWCVCGCGRAAARQVWVEVYWRVI